MLFLLLMISGCSTSVSKPLRVSVNLWIGYSPLFYVEQKGWLKDNNIKLINVVSLSENKHMYLSGFSDAFSGTQYEFEEAKKQFPSLEPLILMDQSYGGDVVMANRDIVTLRQLPSIDVYMEIDSVNKTVLDDFITYHDINRSRLHLINKDPYTTSNLPMMDTPTLIVIYDPYDINLKNKGYKVVDSTKNPQIFVMDALYADEHTLKEFKDEFHILNSLIAKALSQLKNDPKEYYETIKPYFKYKNYEEFLDALTGIKWIYDDRSSSMVKALSKYQISTDNLLVPEDEF